MCLSRYGTHHYRVLWITNNSAKAKKFQQMGGTSFTALLIEFESSIRITWSHNNAKDGLKIMWFFNIPIMQKTILVIKDGYFSWHLVSEEKSL